MLENMIGPEKFRYGVSSYLKQFAYKNAETEDLWKHLEAKSNGINILQVTYFEIFLLFWFYSLI